MDPYNTADAFKVERPQPAVPPAATADPRAGNPYDAAPRAGSPPHGGPHAGANPYAAPVARVAEVASGAIELAGRGQRLVAVILDSLIVAGPAVLAAVMIPAMQGEQRGSLSSGATALLVLIALWFIGFSIYQLVMLHREGQTLGKKLMGVRIVRTDGSRAGLGRIFLLRYFAPGLIGAVPFIGGFFSLADALLIFGAEKRCIHDYFADTIVVTA